MEPELWTRVAGRVGAAQPNLDPLHSQPFPPTLRAGELAAPFGAPSQQLRVLYKALAVLLCPF